MPVCTPRAPPAQKHIGGFGLHSTSSTTRAPFHYAGAGRKKLASSSTNALNCALWYNTTWYKAKHAVQSVGQHL
eukprot:1170899-Rhodomonas_salina.2